VHKVASELQLSLIDAYSTLNDAVGEGRIRFRSQGVECTIQELVRKGEAGRTECGWDLPGFIELNRAHFLKWLHERQPKIVTGAKRGPKASYNWDAAWAFICHCVHEDGLPTKQAEMEKRFADWFGERDQHPAASEIKLRVAMLYREFGR
jgi:hypothetical protein